MNSCGGVREVAGPDTFRESGALYATQTETQTHMHTHTHIENWWKRMRKKCFIIQMKLKKLVVMTCYNVSLISPFIDAYIHVYCIYIAAYATVHIIL